VIGRVLHVHVDDALLDAHLRVDPEQLRAVGRMGGIGYTSTRDRYELPVGRGALERDAPFG
jgi:flavin reductase (DIM6/NTAB) family NADH-FMN oxidoreductase RutF